jgi:hypothetical protein
MIISFSLLFRPSSDHASFRVKENHTIFLMSKWVNFIKLLERYRAGETNIIIIIIIIK